ncbi:MAG: S41 family peptidase [Patescibacteria group bacterium]|nr:S41 family peptidase [Patescibacteria group bacterium]
MSSQNKVSLILSGMILTVIAFMIGVSVGQGKGSLMNTNELTDLTKVTTSDFSPYWKAWQVLDDKYVAAASTTAEQKIYGSIEGLASSYGDPYTVFFPPVENKVFKEDISGDFEGVGMEIGIKNKQLQVVSPLKDSPAEKAGVKTGDLILKIDDHDTVDMPVDQAVKYIRGAKGTAVTITFLRPGGSKPLVKKIVRDVINIPTIDTSEKPGGIYVIRLYSFTAQSANLFREALRSFVVSGDHKLVLDLRGNPGGYLDAAWDMASWFLPGNDTVVTEDFGKNGSPKIYKSKGYNIFSDNLKIIILVDGGSASASEILAGALRENGIGKLVGQKTFGKGSVQELVPITSDTSLKVTIARWLTPSGHNLSENGLDPDYKVDLNEENTSNGKDPVMEKAIELLNSGAI